MLTVVLLLLIVVLPLLIVLYLLLIAFTLLLTVSGSLVQVQSCPDNLALDKQSKASPLSWSSIVSNAALFKVASSTPAAFYKSDHN